VKIKTRRGVMEMYEVDENDNYILLGWTRVKK
jgi:hypothetical protein